MRERRRSAKDRPGAASPRLWLVSAPSGLRPARVSGQAGGGPHDFRSSGRASKRQGRLAGSASTRAAAQGMLFLSVPRTRTAHEAVGGFFRCCCGRGRDTVGRTGAVPRGDGGQREDERAAHATVLAWLRSSTLQGAYRRRYGMLRALSTLRGNQLFTESRTGDRRALRAGSPPLFTGWPLGASPLHACGAGREGPTRRRKRQHRATRGASELVRSQLRRQAARLRSGKPGRCSVRRSCPVGGALRLYVGYMRSFTRVARRTRPFYVRLCATLQQVAWHSSPVAN
jgi:hypothetical protein